MSHDDLKKLVTYNQKTGVFIWNQDRGTVFKKGTVAGGRSKNGYIKITLKGYTYQAHRLAYFYVTGHNPEKQWIVDHVNGKRSDNRWSNLRLVISSDNAKNRRIGTRNKSGVIGVYACGNKWKAGIRVKGKHINLGSYEQKKDAIQARELANKRYKFHKNHGKM